MRLELLFSFYRWGNSGPGRLSDWSKVTPLVSTGTQFKSQAVCFQSPCSLSPAHDGPLWPSSCTWPLATSLWRASSIWRALIAKCSWLCGDERQLEKQLIMSLYMSVWERLLISLGGNKVWSPGSPLGQSWPRVLSLVAVPVDWWGGVWVCLKHVFFKDP